MDAVLVSKVKTLFNYFLENLSCFAEETAIRKKKNSKGRKMEESTIAKSFKQFEIVTDCSDHHYNKNPKSNNGNDSFTSATSSVYKKIMKEWKILEESLPETIFVRVYEQRVDLLRAAIVGAQGTPYHDGLFFFDVAFPQDYPNRPPSVYYHSHGLRLNPNLYENGYVCLSLVNTWGGSGNERWVSTQSSILQLLVSLQGLVLNAKPYFNEPGTKPAASWQAYNKDVFILSCKTMLYCLKNPPKGFEGLVASHFRERANAILKASKDYEQGRATIGYSIDKSKTAVFSKFKEELNKVSKDLELAFNKNGIAEPKRSADQVKEADGVSKDQVNGADGVSKEKRSRKIKDSSSQVKREYWTRSKAAKVSKDSQARKS